MAAEARAKGKYLRTSPQKARLVVDLIRGKSADEARNILRFTRKAAARDVEKVLESAIHNAENRFEDLDVDKLYVASAQVGDGPRMKRIRPAPMGRAYRYQRRMSHIVISVEERAEE
jgi:large subunit ribosomal protein L22